MSNRYKTILGVVLATLCLAAFVELCVVIKSDYDATAKKTKADPLWSQKEKLGKLNPGDIVVFSLGEAERQEQHQFLVHRNANGTLWLKESASEVEAVEYPIMYIAPRFFYTRDCTVDLHEYCGTEYKQWVRKGYPLLERSNK